MNIEQAKAKLNSVNHCTGTKHPKVLISELCVVIKFLLDEIDGIRSSSSKELIIPFLPKPQPKDVKADPPIDRRKPPYGHPDVVYGEPTWPTKSLPLTGDHPHKKGGSEDIE